MADIKDRIEKHAEDKLRSELAAGVDHFRRVYSTAKRIARKAQIDYDEQILHAACFLHDIDQEEPHAEKSAAEAETFLKEIGFPEDKIPPVKKAIICHIPNGEPHTNEAILLHDADLLDFLGATGIARLSIAAWAWFNAKEMDDITKTLKEYRKVYDSLILNESKKLGKNKTIVMDLFIKQLEEELK
ncbi:MAG: HD domain-containing protein [Candidatus Aenigmarchaeota archaeon]|nr:HD domain-containing protein [Candidatus Aenigmarchaeota archaeon]